MTDYSEADVMTTTDKKVLTANKARQGERTGVIWVLIGSGLGAILCLAAAAYFVLS